MHLRRIDLQIISMKSDLISHGSGIPDAENIQASKRRSGALDGIFCLLPRQKKKELRCVMLQSAVHMRQMRAF